MLDLAAADFAKKYCTSVTHGRQRRWIPVLKGEPKENYQKKSLNMNVSKRSVTGSSTLSNDVQFRESTNLGEVDVFEDDDDYIYDGCCAACCKWCIVAGEIYC